MRLQRALSLYQREEFGVGIFVLPLDPNEVTPLEVKEIAGDGNQNLFTDASG